MILHIKTPKGYMDVNLAEFVRRSGSADCRKLLKLIRQDWEHEEELREALRTGLAAEEAQARRDETRLEKIDRLIMALRAEKAVIASPSKRRRAIKVLREEMGR